MHCNLFYGHGEKNLFADMEYNFSSTELNQVICAFSINNLLGNTIDTLI